MIRYRVSLQFGCECLHPLARRGSREEPAWSTESRKSAGEYPWSSLSSYLLPASQRPAWLVVPEVLDLFGFNDTAKGRREFIHRIDDWIRHEKGDPAVAGTSVETRAKEGWSFKEAMLSFLDARVKLKTRSGRNRTYQSSKLVKDHGERPPSQFWKALRLILE